MKRKVLIILLSVLLIFACVFSFMACDKKSGDNKGSGDNNDKTSVTVSGTYYEVNNDVIDEDTYIQFKNSTWTDDGGINGTFTLDGNNLTLFLTIDGEKEEYMSGKVSGDDIKFDDDTVYRKGEDITQKPKRLDFELSEDKSYYIVKGIGGLSGDIEVPETYKQKPVKEIAEKAFANNSNITSIVLPTTINTLGERAFYKCRNLLSAEILGEMQKIPTEIFSGCDSLTSVTLPAVKEIQMDAFKDCSDLEKVTFLGTASDWCMIDFKDGYEGGIGGGTTYYSNPIIAGTLGINNNPQLFIDGEVVKDITVDASEIKANVFNRYTQLKTVTLTSSVTKIGDSAFSYCSNLTSVDMKDSNVISIGIGAFYYNSQLSSVTFPQSLEYIDDSAFEDCKKLQSVELGNSIEEIGENAFGYCESLTTLSLGNSVMTIGRKAFTGGGYTQITIPASVIFIGGYAFSNSSLTSATFERKSGWKVDNTSTGYVTTKELEESWLDDPAAMANYLTNKGYLQIVVCDWYVNTLVYTLSSDGTYYSVKNYGTSTQSSIVIPEKYNNKPVKYIEDYAFRDCYRLKNITIPSSVLGIGTSAFSGCSNLTSIIVDENNTKYLSQDGILYNKEKTEYIHIPKAISGEVVIPSGVTSIGYGAFEGCSSLTSIEIPGSVTSIGDSAFSFCSSLTSIEIPSGVTSIGEGTFYECSSLTIIEIPSSVTSIGYGAFEGCSSLTSIVIPSSVTSIDSYAFSFCSRLTSIEIPSGVTSIGDGAFRGCSSLTSIEIPNSVTYVGFLAFNGCSRLTIYCEAESKPSGWYSDWNVSNRPVTWGYKKQ